MHTYSKIIVFLCLTSILTSCINDDSAAPLFPEGDFYDGTLVLNEGGFSGGGSISFIPNDLTEVKHSIFEDANAGEQIGVFPQSIFFDGDRAFIISNQSNLISIVNRFTFELIDVIDSGLNKPRYGVVLNGKAYVTNQADFATVDDDYVAVIDLETLEVEETVNTGLVAEHIVEVGGMLFVQNAAFDEGNQISKFDPSTNSVSETLEVDVKLNSLHAYNNKLYTLDSVGVKVIDPTSFTVETQIDKPASADGFSNLRIYNDVMYYTQGASVFYSPLLATELSEDVVFDYGSASAFGSFYGFEIHNDQIFVADAGDFASDGTVFIYSLSGREIANFEVGLSPNGFYFQ